jgi:alkylation response protein AidB-like acyl-CoA dehydrogenase
MNAIVGLATEVCPNPTERLRGILAEVAARADLCEDEGAFPATDVAVLDRIGLLRDFAPSLLGGHDFRDRSNFVETLFDCLRLIGRANLSLGRIFEGHVNAILLIDRYGDAAMRSRLKIALAGGKLFGVWNTEPSPGMALKSAGAAWRLAGSKSYATGAGHLDFAVITARLPDGGKQMLVMPVGKQRDRADSGWWKVNGMRATVSGTHDFTGLSVDPEEFLGDPGDYEREPMFTAGAWRFAAVQLGGIEALVLRLRDYIVRGPAKDDPIHRARFAHAVADARTAFQWVREAARRSETTIDRSASVPFVLMTRGVVEDAALRVIETVQRVVGTRAFFTDNPIDRRIRDLQLYLRQPAPDQARDRAALAWLDEDMWEDDRWW